MEVISYKFRVKLLHRVYLFINSFIEILCSAVKIITLTFYLPTWDYKFMFWFNKREFLEKLKRKLDTKPQDN